MGDITKLSQLWVRLPGLGDGLPGEVGGALFAAVVVRVRLSSLIYSAIHYGFINIYPVSSGENQMLIHKDQLLYTINIYKYNDEDIYCVVLEQEGRVVCSEAADIGELVEMIADIIAPGCRNQ